MKLKDYKGEYVFLKLNYHEYKLIPPDEVEEYIKENELVFIKIYGTKNSDWFDDVEDEIKRLMIDRGNYDGIYDIEEILDFDDEDFEKGVKYLEKFIDKVRERFYEVDYEVEIELGDEKIL